MEHFKYVILGAGPSGLSFAHTLRLLGEESFVVIDKESVAGGLCRSAIVDGKPLDIGGGHFLDVKRKDVLELLFRFMPREEWQEHRRVSKIRIRGVEIDHPLEGNLWQLPIADQMDFLESIAKGGRAARRAAAHGIRRLDYLEAGRVHRARVHAALQPQDLGDGPERAGHVLALQAARREFP